MTVYRYPAANLTQLPRPGRHRAYRAYIRSQCCLVSGKTWDIEACHTGPHALGRKANDLDCIPLNREFHRGGLESYHYLGRIAFEQHHKINIHNEIQVLQERAIACGIKLECEPRLKRKGFGRASVRKKGSVEGAA